MKRTLDVRFLVLRNDAVYSEIFAVSPPALRMDSGGNIKLSLSGDFFENPDVDWLRDNVQPVLVIDGIEHPLGVLVPTTMQDMEDTQTKSVHVEMFDRSWLVSDSITESNVYIAAGTNYITAIESQLTAAGIVLVQATPTSAILAEAREDWGVGTSRLEIVNQLLGEINYNSLWFDARGFAVLEPASVPKAANIEHTIDASEVKSLVIPGIKAELDIFDTPNVFICVCSNPDKTDVMIARAENNNPQSPLSISRRGRRVAKVFNVDNIASQAELQRYAERLRNNSMMLSQVIEVETALHPDYGAFDVTALNYGEYSGICIEKAWEMQLMTGGIMRHTLEKVVYAFE